MSSPSPVPPLLRFPRKTPRRSWRLWGVLALLILGLWAWGDGGLGRSVLAQGDASPTIAPGSTAPQTQGDRPAAAPLPTLQDYYPDLTFPPLPDIQLPAYERFTLGNGLGVYLMEDHELPLVQGSFLVRVGDRWEPANQAGLGSLVGELLRDGGTDRHSVQEINTFLENHAAAIETSISTTAGQVSFSALGEDLEPVLGLVAEILRQPAFGDDRLELAKTRRRGSIARRNDNPSAIASREFIQLLYGEDSPYGWTEEYTTLDNIDRAAVVDFYQRYFHPDRILMGIVGDFDPATTRPLIENLLGDWQTFGPPLPPLPPVTQAHIGELFTIDQPTMTQSYIQMGQLGETGAGQLNSPDFPALSVLNEVLNGFGGRLYNQVRSRQGLAYSVSSQWQPNYDFPGLFIAQGQTRTETTLEFLAAVHQELENLAQQPISAAELQYAKDVVLNSFGFSFQAPSQTLSRLLRYEYYGYPADFIFQYRAGVEAVTIADVQRVAQTHWQPDRWITLIVGNIAPLEPAALAPFSPKGTITPLDITLPPAP